MRSLCPETNKNRVVYPYSVVTIKVSIMLRSEA